MQFCRPALPWTSRSFKEIGRLPRLGRDRTQTSALYTRCRTYLSQASVKPHSSKDELALGSLLRERLSSIQRFLEDIDSATDWQSLRKQVDTLKSGLDDENVWVENAVKASRDQMQMARLEKKLSTYEILQEQSTQLSELSELALTSSDVQMQQELLSELDDVKSRSEKYLVSLWLSGPVDENAAYIEIHAGSGGTDACDWASMLSRMYAKWAREEHNQVQVVDETPGDVAGVKSTVLLVDGPYAYGYLRYESGIHRLVRLSPFDSSKQRHTSFASVRVLPHFDENEENIGIQINPADLKITTMRSQGAGGQHVNKTESAVRIVHVPSGLVVSSQQERSQHQNRTIALARLKSKLYEMETQKRAQARSDAHEALPENAWGSQIRSYVLQPYQLVKDARTGYETDDVEGVLDGHITGLLKASLRKFKAKQQVDTQAS